MQHLQKTGGYLHQANCATPHLFVSPFIRSFPCYLRSDSLPPSMRSAHALPEPFQPLFCAPESAKLLLCPRERRSCSTQSGTPLRKRRVLVAAIAAPNFCSFFFSSSFLNPPDLRRRTARPSWKPWDGCATPPPTRSNSTTS